MFGLEILDVAVGLVLTYLLMSLILTSVQEGIEGILKTRAADLERAIGELLQRDDKLVKEFYKHPLIHALYLGTPPAPQAGGKTPSSAERPSGLTKKQLPSYIPRETFSAAVLDLIAGGEKNKELAQALEGLRQAVGDRPERLRRELEGWYDAAMDRASGWFKRRTQGMLFLMGLAVAILLNVNSVTIAQQLATDEQARAYADRIAEQIMQGKTPPAADSEEVKALTGQYYQIGLPIGWNDVANKKFAASLPQDQTFGDAPVQWIGAVLVLGLGYLVTAFALMLGAPFWFDVLNRIMVIRSTIKPREKSPDEPSTEGGQQPPAPEPAAAAPATPPLAKKAKPAAA